MTPDRAIDVRARYVVIQHDRQTWQVIDRQSIARRVPRVYQTYTSEAAAVRCASVLNDLQSSYAHYAGDVSHGIGLQDWVTTDRSRVTCQRCIDYLQTHLGTPDGRRP